MHTQHNLFSCKIKNYRIINVELGLRPTHGKCKFVNKNHCYSNFASIIFSIITGSSFCIKNFYIIFAE